MILLERNRLAQRIGQLAQVAFRSVEGTHMDTDDLFFENQDDDTLEEQLLGDEGHDPGEEEPNRGDLNIALKRERDEKRQLREQLEASRKELERREALLEQLGTRRQEPKEDPAVVRERMLTRLLEAPDETLNQRDQFLLNQVHQMNAPLYEKAARADVIEHPEYGELYKTRPMFKTTIDAYISQQIAANGRVNPEDLDAALSHLGALIGEAGGGGKPSNDAAKARLKSIAEKPQGTRKAEDVLEDKMKLAERAMRGDREAAKKYSAWESSPEGKALLNKALKEGRF